MNSEHKVIVAAPATNQPSDKQQAVSMVEEATVNTGEVPRELSADAGYYSAKAVDELCALGVDPFIAPERIHHGTRPEPSPRGRIPKGVPQGQEAADEAWPGALRSADGDGDCGSGIRTDHV